MKTYNQYRHTNQFAITGQDAKDIMKILEFGQSHKLGYIVGIAKHSDNVYCVRVTNSLEGVKDYLLDTLMAIRIMETTDIIPFTVKVG